MNSYPRNIRTVCKLIADSSATGYFIIEVGNPFLLKQVYLKPGFGFNPEKICHYLVSFKINQVPVNN